MFIKLSTTEIFDTATNYIYRLDKTGNLEVYNDYQNKYYSYEQAIVIWEKLLERIVYQSSQYLSALYDSKSCRLKSQDLKDQLFEGFEELKRSFEPVQAEINYETPQNQGAMEYIEVKDIEF